MDKEDNNIFDHKGQKTYLLNFDCFPDQPFPENLLK